jgi:HK97 family phage portal protein
VGLFSKKKPKAENSLSTSKSIFWGGSTAGTPVNEISAMQTAAVYSCVRVISETLAALPLHVYRREDSGTRPIPAHHLYNLLHNAPNPEMTSFIFRETLMGHLLIYGNAFAQIMRDSAGRVTALYPLLPHKTDVWRGESGEIYYTYWCDRDEANARNSDKTGEPGGVTLRKDQVLHIPGLSFNGLVGYSPIALAKNAVGMAIATENYGAGFFANGANPGGVLEFPGDFGEKGVAHLRDAWEVIHRGVQNSGKIAVLESGMTYHPISVPPEQAQFLETRRFQLNEIARIFRVPPHMIGDLEKSSFSNIEQQSLEFVKYCINPWVERWEQTMWLNLILPSEKPTHLIKFNVDGLLRGDYETRMKGYATGIQNGFLCPNDVRKLENMNEIPAEEGGFNFMVNGNMVKLKDVGAAYRKGEQNKSEPNKNE